MSNPLVCCILLTADRPEMTKRALQCFEAQTYGNRKLLMLDTGQNAYTRSPQHASLFLGRSPRTIGELRNYANRTCPSNVDLFAHWDSDDWSHRERLAEQVAFIQSDSTLDAVGYSDLLFWDSQNEGKAWIWERKPANWYYMPGTSLLYRREAWGNKPFEDVMTGEDQRWLQGLKTAAVSSVPKTIDAYRPGNEPRMIASIHGANTSSRIIPHSENWRRVPEYDQHCRETMTSAGCGSQAVEYQ